MILLYKPANSVKLIMILLYKPANSVKLIPYSTSPLSGVDAFEGSGDAIVLGWGLIRLTSAGTPWPKCSSLGGGL
jgi:hypothetical protein